MRWWKFVLLGTLVGFGSVASAGVLNTEQTLRLRFTDYSRPNATVSALQSVEALSPPLAEIRLSTPSLLSLNTVVPVTDPLVGHGSPVEVKFTSVRPRPDLQGGVFGQLSSAIGNPQVAASPRTLPLEGQLRLCFASTGCTGPTIVFPLGETTSSGGFVGAGVGGILTMSVATSIQVSVLGAPWTIHTATAIDRTAGKALVAETTRGFAHGPVSLTGTTTLTSGVLGLVSASQVQTTGFPGTSDYSAVFHRLTIRFVPEPSRGVLWVAGALMLVGLGVRSR